MALVQDKVSRLAPFVTCALFSATTTRYECWYAHGPGTEALFKWHRSRGARFALRLPSCADGRKCAGNELTACCRAWDLRRAADWRPGHYRTAAGCFTDEHWRVLGRVSEQAAASSSTRRGRADAARVADRPAGPACRTASPHLQFETGLATPCADGSISVVVLDMDGERDQTPTATKRRPRARVIGSVLKSMRARDRLARASAGTVRRLRGL